MSQQETFLSHLSLCHDRKLSLLGEGGESGGVDCCHKRRFYLCWERVFNCTLSPASFLASCQSDHHMMQCWLVECMVIWVWSQHSLERKLSHLLAANISNQSSYMPSPILMVFFRINKSFILLLCFSLWEKHGSHSSCFLFFSMEYELWHSDWLKRLVIGSREPCTVVTRSVFIMLAAGPAVDSGSGWRLGDSTVWFYAWARIPAVSAFWMPAGW